jgi:hypothetical protein
MGRISPSTTQAALAACGSSLVGAVSTSPAACGGDDESSGSQGSETIASERSEGGEKSIEEFGAEASGNTRSEMLTAFRARRREQWVGGLRDRPAGLALAIGLALCQAAERAR